MAAERVPRQLARKAVILVQVLARVREHDLRVGAPRKILKDLFDLTALIGKEAVAKAVNLDLRPRRRCEEGPGTRASLSLAFVPRRQDDPRHLEIARRACEREQRAPATDLDVVCMAADGKHAAPRLAA